LGKCPSTFAKGILTVALFGTPGDQITWRSVFANYMILKYPGNFPPIFRGWATLAKIFLLTIFLGKNASWVTGRNLFPLKFLKQTQKCEIRLWSLGRPKI